MKKFWIKMCSLVLLLFLIGGYNTVLAMREQRDEIARLTAELEGSKMTVSALKEQQAKKTENTAAEALKGADAMDTISGATFSSTGLREAVTQALEKAE